MVRSNETEAFIRGTEEQQQLRGQTPARIAAVATDQACEVWLEPGSAEGDEAKGAEGGGEGKC